MGLMCDLYNQERKLSLLLQTEIRYSKQRQPKWGRKTIDGHNAGPSLSSEMVAGHC